MLALALLAQAPAAVKVHLKTDAPGVSLVDRASKKVLCHAPCGELLAREEGTQFQLLAPGVLDSAPFSLTGAADVVTVQWTPATSVTRFFGTGLIILGGAAVMAAIAIGLTAMFMGIACASNGTACPSLAFAYSAIPLAIGGYVALGIGMTLSFRFGIETLEIEAAPGF